APSMPVLVLGRVLQGLGAGAIPAVAYVAIGRALPEHLRGRMFATLSAAWARAAQAVAHALDGLVPARPARSVRRRRDRRGVPLAARVPWAAAAHRDRRRHVGGSAPGE